jgi:flagellar biosynthesis anti-sigma factor FlgM
VNKNGPNTSYSASEDRDAKHSVVTSITRKRKPDRRESTEKPSALAALSAQAIDLATLERKINLLPEIDTAKVVDIHNRIMTGEYEIDANRLANKLQDFESSL